MDCRSSLNDERRLSTDGHLQAAVGPDLADDEGGFGDGHFSFFKLGAPIKDRI